MKRHELTSSEDPTHRQFPAFLESLRPTEAAFVLHLSQCERCRNLAEEFLPIEAAVLARERDYILDLAGSLFSLVNRIVPQHDLSPAELRSFLRSLAPPETYLIRHLLTCPRCRELAVKRLAPKSIRPGRRPASAAHEVLQ